MYLEHFGLSSLPFENLPDPGFYYAEGQYQLSLAALKEAVDVGRGLVVVSGPIGAGKTTLGHMLVSDRGGRNVVVGLPMPPSTDRELYAYIAQELGCAPQADVLFLLRGIREACIRLIETGRRCLVVLDEAHLATPSSLEAVRILSNLEYDAKKLVQLFLFGQQQLDEILNKPEMDALTQRIAARLTLRALSPEAAAAYIRHRLAVAGAGRDIFTPQALAMAAEASGGVPRLINGLCHGALTIAGLRSGHAVEPEDVHLAAKERGFGNRTRAFLQRRGLPDAFSATGEPAPPPEVPEPKSAPSPQATPERDARAASYPPPRHLVNYPMGEDVLGGPSLPSSQRVAFRLEAPEEPAVRPAPPAERSWAYLRLALAILCLCASVLFFHSRRQELPGFEDIGRLLPAAWHLLHGG